MFEAMIKKMSVFVNNSRGTKILLDQVKHHVANAIFVPFFVVKKEFDFVKNNTLLLFNN
jgi:hypothetical protein